MLSKVPESISAFTNEKMDQLDAKSIADLVALHARRDLRSSEQGHFDPRREFDRRRRHHRHLYRRHADPAARARASVRTTRCRPCSIWSAWKSCAGRRARCSARARKAARCATSRPQPSLTDYSVYAKTESLDDRSTARRAMKAAPRSAVRSSTTSWAFASARGARHDGGWIDKVDYMTGADAADRTPTASTPMSCAARCPGSRSHRSPSRRASIYQNRDQNNIDQYWVGLSNPGDGDYKTGTPENMGDRDHFVLPALKVDYDLGGRGADLQHVLFRPPRSSCRTTAARSTISPISSNRCDSGLNPDFVTPCTGGTVRRLCGQTHRSQLFCRRC